MKLPKRIPSTTVRFIEPDGYVTDIRFKDIRAARHAAAVNTDDGSFRAVFVIPLPVRRSPQGWEYVA